MRQAIKLYYQINRRQIWSQWLIVLSFIILGMANDYIQAPHHLNFTSSGVTGSLLGILFFISAACILRDKWTHINTWLFTQNISRGQLFLAKVIWMMCLPIVVVVVIGLGVALITHPHSLMNEVVDIISTVLTNIVSLVVFLLIISIIGITWQRIVGYVFVMITFSSALAVERRNKLAWVKLLTDLNTTYTNLLMLCLIVVLLGFTYYFYKQMGTDTDEEAVRIPMLKWPIVIFVFVMTIVGLWTGYSYDIEDNWSMFVLAAVLSGTTYYFVFKPTIQLPKIFRRKM